MALRSTAHFSGEAGRAARRGAADTRPRQGLGAPAAAPPPRSLP
jgi:hypothetical protein